MSQTHKGMVQAAWVAQDTGHRRVQACFRLHGLLRACVGMMFLSDAYTDLFLNAWS
jgi:hypothetical protein